MTKVLSGLEELSLKWGTHEILVRKRSLEPSGIIKPETQANPVQLICGHGIPREYFTLYRFCPICGAPVKEKPPG